MSETIAAGFFVLVCFLFGWFFLKENVRYYCSGTLVLM